MSKIADRTYHEERVHDELRRAQEAADPSAAQAHRELAALHRRRMLEIVLDAGRELRLPEPIEREVGSTS